MAQGRVAWGVFCRAWLPSPFFSVIAGCVEGVCLVNVWSSWGKREREREREKKQKHKLFFPRCTSRGRRRSTVPFKMTPCCASFFFYEQWMK